MRKPGSFPVLTAGVLAVLLVSASAAVAGVFRGPYDFSVGPYRGGQGWSYNESYGYFGVPSTSEYPYYAFFPYTIYTPYGYGLRNNRWGYYGDGVYGMNPAYLIPPRPPGYIRSMKESAKDVVLPPVNQINGLAALIDIKMPCYGELWVDGVATEQLGTDRLFRSPPLEKGGEYVYILRARWIANGQPIEQSQQVRVHCGERVQVVFPKPAQPVQP
jgi:uncharacterized protein (TIGR03000 family)